MLGSVSWPTPAPHGFKPERAAPSVSRRHRALLSPYTGCGGILHCRVPAISYLQAGNGDDPTILYYHLDFLMIEADARRAGTRPAAIETSAMDPDEALRLSLHVLSRSRFSWSWGSRSSAVFWATLLAGGTEFHQTRHSALARQLADALRAGATGVLRSRRHHRDRRDHRRGRHHDGAGIEDRRSDRNAGGWALFLTVLYSALAVWSRSRGAGDASVHHCRRPWWRPRSSRAASGTRRHMFIFYYAVLSEVSPRQRCRPSQPPRSPGGDPFKTMMLTWKYTLPAPRAVCVHVDRRKGPHSCSRRLPFGHLDRGDSRDWNCAFAGAFGGGFLARQSFERYGAGDCRRVLSSLNRRWTCLVWSLWLWCWSCTGGGIHGRQVQ